MCTPSSVYKNRFEALSGTQEESTSQEKKRKLPLIFLNGVENYQEMKQLIEKVVNGNEYTAESKNSRTGLIKII